MDMNVKRKKNKESLTYQDYVKGIEELKPEEQLSLVEIISARLKKNLRRKRHSHNITELEGLGADIWEAVNVEEYIHKERESWD